MRRPFAKGQTDAVSTRWIIDYTKRANVWKANGAKPGMVLYEGHKTLTVAPDAALVKQLEKEMED